MLWSPDFTIWQTFGVSTNSQMMVLSGDLERQTDIFFGFNDDVQDLIINDAIPQLQ